MFIKEDVDVDIIVPFCRQVAATLEHLEFTDDNSPSLLALTMLGVLCPTLRKVGLSHVSDDSVCRAFLLSTQNHLEQLKLYNCSIPRITRCEALRLAALRCLQINAKGVHLPAILATCVNLVCLIFSPQEHQRNCPSFQAAAQLSNLRVFAFTDRDAIRDLDWQGAFLTWRDLEVVELVDVRSVTDHNI